MTGCLNAKSTKKHWILSELCIFGHKQEIKKIPFISIKKIAFGYKKYSVFLDLLLPNMMILPVIMG